MKCKVLTMSMVKQSHVVLLCLVENWQRTKFVTFHSDVLIDTSSSIDKLSLNFSTSLLSSTQSIRNG